MISIFVSLWLGFVLSISFMESWLKFRAKGITLEIGLSVGKLVFKALNIVEWLFTFIIAGLFLKTGATGIETVLVLFLCLVLILLIDTFILLPVLGKRAHRIMGGERIEPSKTHLWYVLGEVLKVFLMVCILVILL